MCALCGVSKFQRNLQTPLTHSLTQSHRNKAPDGLTGLPAQVAVAAVVAAAVAAVVAAAVAAVVVAVAAETLMNTWVGLLADGSLDVFHTRTFTNMCPLAS